jgi:eukaryotic-like serine/threonine-protein kinase
MPLSAGTHLGSYEILAPIGAGGMGEVYKARDTKLDREVAIKVLPAALARDPERLARFEREAKVLASLNHPNIAQIYGIEESDSGRALVMELVPGHTLTGPLPLSEALRIAGQIADALEAAHDKGIVHRDLKPANIMITPDGVVKVLDFGLAAVTQPSAASGDPNNSPTLTMGATQAGMILGTAGYMAPEQAAGQAVDKRADIWSFGVVFYEMLTGQRLFTGDSVAHILADVLRGPIDFDKVPAATPRAIRDLVKRCLDRDVKTRLRDIGEARIAIQNLGKEPEVVVPAPSEPRHRSWLPWCIAAFLLLALMPVNILHFREQPPQEPSLRFQIPLPEKVAADTNQTISPDGRYLVFSGQRTASGTLWVRPLNSLTAEPLAGTEGAYFPFWSPDSKSIGFFANGKLKRIEVNGGPALALADAPLGIGGTWVQDGNSGGVILFANYIGPILRVSGGGGTASPVTKLRTGETSHHFPWFLPDGRHFLYLAEATDNRNTIHVGDLSTPDDRVIGDADSQAVYSQGFLLLSRQDTLMAQPFDARRGIATGDAVPLEQRIPSQDGPHYADFSASASGLLAFRTGSSGARVQLTWVDRSGKQLGPLGEPANIGGFHFSPDRKRVAAESRQDGDIWIYDAARGLRTRFTFDPAPDRNPVWSPDGRSVIFTSRRKQHFDLYRKYSDGAGADELLYSDDMEKYATSWSPDGKFLLYSGSGAGGGNVWVLPLTPERPGGPLKPFPFAPSSSSVRIAQFSPDGQWIAYQSDESKRYEIYVARFPGAGSKRQISVTGGISPRWRRDGKEIFYMKPDSTIMAAAVTSKADALEVGEVRPLFGPVAVYLSAYRYDVSADGQRFLVALAGETVLEPSRHGGPELDRRVEEIACQLPSNHHHRRPSTSVAPHLCAKAKAMKAATGKTRLNPSTRSAQVISLFARSNRAAKRLMPIPTRTTGDSSILHPQIQPKLCGA